MRKVTPIVSAILFAAAISTPVHAVTEYWDPTGSAGLGGSGAWDTTSLVWSLDGNPTSAPATWTDGNDANFGGTAGGTVTVNGTRTVGTITFPNNVGAYTITGGTLFFTNGAQSVVMPTSTTNSLLGETINSSITGGDFTVYDANTGTATGRVLLNLGGVNNFTGNLTIGGAGSPTAGTASADVNIAAASALPSTATVMMQRNWSELLFTAGATGGYTASFSNNINLNSGNASGVFTSIIGATAQKMVATLTGTISGNSDLNFQVGTNGGSGTVILNPTTANTYTGNTNILTGSDGIVSLGKNDALPITTTLSFGGAGSTAGNLGSFDLNGHNQTVSALTSSTKLGTPPSNGYIGGIVNNTSSLSTFTINGSSITKYDGPIGTPPPAVGTVVFNDNLPNASTNIALHLASTNTGTLILTNAMDTMAGFNGSNYTGGTVIDGGRLIAGNSIGSATGNGPVTVNAGGTLASLGGGSYGTIAGHVTASANATVVPGVQITTTFGTSNPLPAASATSSIGTLTLSGGLTLNAGSNLNFEFSTSGNDQIVLGGASDANILSLSATPQSVNLNLVDLGGAITSANVYNLFSYPAGSLASLSTSAFKIVPPSGVASQATYSLINDSADGLLKLSVTGPFGSNLTWMGSLTAGTRSGTWDVNTTPNFTGPSGSTNFHNGDVVTFDDSPAGSDNPAIVTVDAGGVSPGNVIFNNSAVNYTIQGGPIVGTGGITLNGTGNVVLSNANTYTGGTVINGGILDIASDASLGTAPSTPAVNVTIARPSSGATTNLRFDGDTTLNANRTILLSQKSNGSPNIDTNGHNVTIAGQMLGATGGVNLVKVGAGTLTLLGDNSTSLGGGFINAVFVNGGTLAVSQDVSLGQLTKGITLNGGILQFGASFNPTGRGFTISGGSGTINTNGFNSTIDGVLGSSGQFTKTGAGTLTLAGANTLTGVTIINGGTLALKSAAFAPVLTNAGGATLNAGQLVFDYSGAADPTSTVSPLLKSSHDDANFTDASQRFRTANANDASHGIGYYDNTSSSKLTLAYTYYGDANIDGKIDGDDYTLIDRGFAKHLTGWQNGDFNYDGIIDSSDYMLIDTSFLQTHPASEPSLLAEREAEFGSAYVSSLVAAVPEPTSIGLMLLAAPMAFRRRRNAKI